MLVLVLRSPARSRVVQLTRADTASGKLWVAGPGREKRTPPARTASGASVSGATVVALGTSVLSGSDAAGGDFFLKKLNIYSDPGITPF